jgi:hypothetical protein
MDVTADELAGVVDLFGGLTREELETALAELAYRGGEEYDTDTHGQAIDGAIESYHLIVVSEHGLDSVANPVLVAGPTAFPELPPDARDLLHILDIESREIERSAAASGAVAAFRRDVTAAIDEHDTDRIATLLDLSYELEAWGPIDLSDERDWLDEV